MIDVPILVKDALRDGRLLKNYRILVLNDDGTTDFVIDNDTLVKETVSIDERMCSGDTIKFGLCEGSSLEFQYFDHPSIYGRQLNVFVDVWSDYAVQIEEPSWHNIKSLTETDGTFTVVEPGTYKIDYVGPISFKIEWTRNGVTYHDEIFPMAGADSYPLGDLVAGDTIRAYTEYALYTFSVDLKGYYAEVSHWYTIPLGFFSVEKCSRQASTGIKKVTAYNKLQSAFLDQKANQLIIDFFGTNSVAVIDINRFLLDNYGVEYVRKELFKWGPDTKYYSDPQGHFSPFRYQSLKGDQGLYSPWYLKELYGSSFSTSTNIYFQGVVFPEYYEVPDIYYNKYIQIDIDDKAIDADAQIAAHIKSELNKINGTATGDVLWTRFQDMVCYNAYYHPIPFTEAWKAYFFSVSILFGDGHYEVYGNNALNPTGSFEDLQKKTLYDARYIFIYTPYAVKYGWDFYETHEIYKGQEFQVCGSHTYNYYDNNMNTVSAYSPVPRYSDGTAIQWPDLKDYFTAFVIVDEVGDIERITLNPNTIPNVTLRELQSAVYETECKFGKLDRETDLFAGVELNNSRLYPATTLYPDNALYPDGAALSSEKNMYSKLWADEGNIQSWRNLIITYKGLDENNQEKDFTLQRQVNADGTQDYNMSDNWLFKNLVWTAEDVGDYADAMVAKMRNITWFPFEMWCAGLPYLETGDELEISIGETTYTSYVLQRQLKGIQNLQDTYINGTLDIF